jgi:hypothetical protein
MLHASFFDLFRDLAFPHDEELANRLWHTMQNDSSQRMMLDHVLKSTDRLPIKFKRGLLWAIKMAGSFSRNRNDFAHLSYVWIKLKDKAEHETMIPDYFSNSEKVVKKHTEHGLADWHKLYGDLIALKNYVDFIGLSLNSSMLKHPVALPYRPRLQSAAAKSSEGSQKRRRQMKRARARRPQS